jgi:hypothetical protein
MFLAGAVHTPMLSTGCAGAQKLFAKSRARTVETDAGVRSRDTAMLGEVLYALVSEIDVTKGLRVLRFQPLKDSVKTGADLVLEASR